MDQNQDFKEIVKEIDAQIKYIKDVVQEEPDLKRQKRLINFIRQKREKLSEIKNELNLLLDDLCDYEKNSCK